MKKLISLLMMLFVALSFAACDDENTDEDANTGGYEMRYFIDWVGFGPNEDSDGVIPIAWYLPSYSKSPYNGITKTTEITKDKDGNPVEKEVSEYNSEGILVKVTEYEDWDTNALDFSTSSVTFDGTYDAGSKTFTATTFDEDDFSDASVLTKVTIKYNSDGLVEEVVEYEGSTVRTKHTVTYNQYKLAEKYVLDDGTYEWINTYEYQSNNDLPKKRVRDRKTKSSGDIIMVSTITYTMEDAFITKIEEDNRLGNRRGEDTKYTHTIEKNGDEFKITKKETLDNSADKEIYEITYANNLLWKSKSYTKTTGGAQEDVFELEIDYKNARFESAIVKDDGDESEITFTYE